MATERARSEGLVALLTPIAKAFFTDTGLESCVHGQQVFGGHGYIREWGQEQLVRDVRISQIYEGTNGIQALDLLGRKVLTNEGTLFNIFAGEIRAFVAQMPQEAFSHRLLEALGQLEALSHYLIKIARTNPYEAGAAAVDYLHIFGYTAYAYMWARMARAATGKEDSFHQAKLATAHFYFDRLLPRIESLISAARVGSACLYVLDAEQF